MALLGTDDPFMNEPQVEVAGNEKAHGQVVEERGERGTRVDQFRRARPQSLAEAGLGRTLDE
jgi:hypothetical protein